MQSECLGSSLVAPDEYLVCGVPDGGEVRQAPLPHGQGKHLLPED